MASTGWPHLFGPFHNGNSAESNVNPVWSDRGPRERWRTTVGTGYSAPVVANERVVIAHRLDDEEHLECFDAHSGESLWRFSFPTTYQCEYRYSSGPYSTPVIDGSRVYAIGAQGQCHCLDLKSGTLIWRRDLTADFEVPEGLFAFGASPILLASRLIVSAGGQRNDSGIVALDAKTGSTLWTATDHTASYATPIAATIHGQPFVFVVTFEGLVSLDPRTGHVDWSISHRPKSPDTVNATSPIVCGDRVLMVTGPGPGALCVQVLPDRSFLTLWRDRRVLDSQFNTLVLAGDYVLGFTSRRQGGASLRCVTLATGRLCWEWASPLDRGSAIACGEHLILWGEYGHLGSLRIDPAAPRPISMTAEPLLSAPCYSAPALAQGLLYLRNESTLLCLDLRSPQ
ncbi:MAG: PQQ-like beta-propeller repeat protein [Planctomycetales bacterium]|nr:PQQ-like beta-propeller repeat protein [Planctomycetales bacterium]